VNLKIGFPYPSIISISRSKRDFQNFSSGSGHDDKPIVRLILDPPGTGKIDRLRIAIAAAIVLSDRLQQFKIIRCKNTRIREKEFNR
jgi:hypothetical protein